MTSKGNKLNKGIDLIRKYELLIFNRASLETRTEVHIKRDIYSPTFLPLREGED